MNSLGIGRYAVRGITLLLAAVAVAVSSAWAASARGAEGQNLVADPSFEQSGPADQFGHVFPKWGGWKYEGECDFRVGRVAHSGKTSCLLFGSSQPKIRISQPLPKLPAGRYQITAWIRGLDIGTGVWNQTTEFMFNDKYMNLKKNGTFGWTPLRYVADVPDGKDGLGPSFGLMASGYFWIDDVVMQKVGNDVSLTAEPELGKEERPIAPPGTLSAGNVRCPECGYKSMHDWKTCYACGTTLGAAKQGPSGPPSRLLASFEDRSPMEGVKTVAEHATHGAKAARIDKGYAVWDGLQDWSGYDFLLVDMFVDAAKPLELYVELQDQATRDYWTRVNYNTLAPPGKSTLVLPLEQLYVGEKSRPGRRVLLGGIKRFVLAVGDNPPGPLFVDNIRLERDTQTPAMLFDGLWAFDLGPSQSPLMPGFTRLDPSTLYSAGRGYGLKDAVIWRTFDALQPDPLYQDFLCVERGGLAVDVPNGRYHVMVNIDSPSGFWGEYQVYSRRAVLAEGKPVVEEKMDLDRFKKQYFRFWDVEDRAADNTFDKYQRRYFQEKHFEVEVRDGQLNVDFQGENWGCCVSAVIVFPVEKAAEGKRFLDFVTERRRFFFDNYFHRVLHKPTGDPVAAGDEDTRRGYVTFVRDYMQDVYDNDLPRRDEIGQPIRGFGFADEMEPLTLGIYPLSDLGRVTVRTTDLTGPGTIPASCIRAGWVSNRLSRVSMDGAVYTIQPRLVMPGDSADVSKGLTRRYWLTVRPPKDAPPGVYRGELRIEPQHGRASSVPIEYRVCKGTLDAVDIPAGPWGHEIRLPWLESDPATARWNETLARRSMEKIREYGFTTFTGLPLVFYRGFKDGKPELDFTAADRQMQLARQCGFTMPVVTYVGMPGLDLYYRDEAAMRAAGFTDYSKFVKAVFSAIQAHANQAGWLPVYWNLGDEPIGDDLRRAAENAEAYHAAFGQGPPWFTAATSFTGERADDPHFRFARALTAANLNLHDEASIRALHRLGSGWGFYNGGNRWTYGTYMYKAARQFNMKFRLSWHWNVVAGDPYYALDCREDDYAWCNSSPEGELIPSVHFERDMREGIDDYRYLLTLARLAEAKNDAQAKELLRKRLDSFKLGQREHDELLPADDWSKFRWQAAKEIERLR